MADPLKVALRNTMKQIRMELSCSYRTSSSRHVCQRIQTLEQYQNAKHIALYSAINGEIDLRTLWETTSTDKLFYFPKLNEDKTLSFLPATATTLFKENQYGILEPDVDPTLAIPVEALDLIILPLLAFDIHCTRLGMGSGYYDRTLENQHHLFCLGVGYQFQRVDFIAQRPWDVPLNAVLTPKALYWRYSD